MCEPFADHLSSAIYLHLLALADTMTVMNSGSALASTPPPPLAPGEKGCADCGRSLDVPGKRRRPDKAYCSSRCRREAWSSRTVRSVASITAADFAVLRARLAKLTQGRPSHSILGYALRYHSPVGEVNFPEPGRRTKRAPDEHGVWRMSAEPFYRIEPFEFPRVPVDGRYEILLVDDARQLVRTNDRVDIKVVFPSVQLYDARFHYDRQGRIVWEGKRRRRVKRRPERQDRGTADSSVVSSQTEKEPAATNGASAPTAATLIPVSKPQGQPSSFELQIAELTKKVDQLQREVSMERTQRLEIAADRDRLNVELSRERAAKEHVQAELYDATACNRALVRREAARRSEASSSVPPMPVSGGPAESKTASAPSGAVRLLSAAVTIIPTPPNGSSAVAVAPASPVKVTGQSEPSTPISLATPSGPNEPPPPIEVAPQVVPPSATPPEPTSPQIAETPTLPEPKTAHPKPEPKSGEPSRQPQNSSTRAGPPKKIPDGPIIGIAAQALRKHQRFT